MLGADGGLLLMVLLESVVGISCRNRLPESIVGIGCRNCKLALAMVSVVLADQISVRNIYKRVRKIAKC